ncbi:MAG TPA: hypothetical protein PLM16_01925 [Candidatus Woesebacteria bacterium]|mgnify:CR=1 FL=1|nr:hypothetical protein [Candidatus Woesebacteria bacterium]
MPQFNQVKNSTPPLNTKTIIWLLTTFLVVLMYLTGYYHSLYKLERKRYLKLEDKYVRVRNMLGREVMQDLIDESYLQNQ